jgi:propionyl-CoA carboxylase alpha chain
MVVPRFVVPGLEAVAGSLNAPMPGTILDVRAKVGDRVTKGATLVVMEAMKMEHHISAPLDGEIVDVLVAVGDQVANGAPLLVLEELSDDSVDEAT